MRPDSKATLQAYYATTKNREVELEFQLCLRKYPNLTPEEEVLIGYLILLQWENEEFRDQLNALQMSNLEVIKHRARADKISRLLELHGSATARGEFERAAMLADDIERLRAEQVETDNTAFGEVRGRLAASQNAIRALIEELAPVFEKHLIDGPTSICPFLQSS